MLAEAALLREQVKVGRVSGFEFGLVVFRAGEPTDAVHHQQHDFRGCRLLQFLEKLKISHSVVSGT